MTDPAASAIDFDLYCLTCGYNLRGLLGDPVQCPECGAMNGVAEPIVPSALILAETQMMERLPRYTILLALVLAPIGALGAILPTVFPWVGAVLVLLIALFGIATLFFYNDCRGQPGWLSCLLAYWCASAVLVSVSIAIAWFAAPWRDLFDHAVKVPIALGLALSSIWIGHRLVLQPVLTRMQQLLRKSAFERARERLRARARAPR